MVMVFFLLSLPEAKKIVKKLKVHAIVIRDPMHELELERAELTPPSSWT